MTGNPYYSLLTLMDGGQVRLAVATLENAQEERFRVEGPGGPIAGRAKGLTLEPDDEGGCFLCAGGSGGWFVLCRLEER